MNSEAQALLEAPLAAINSVIEDMEMNLMFLRQSGNFHSTVTPLSLQQTLPSPAATSKSGKGKLTKGKEKQRTKEESKEVDQRQKFGSKRHHSSPNILALPFLDQDRGVLPTNNPKNPASRKSSATSSAVSYGSTIPNGNFSHGLSPLETTVPAPSPTSGQFLDEPGRSRSLKKKKSKLGLGRSKSAVRPGDLPLRDASGLTVDSAKGGLKDAKKKGVLGGLFSKRPSSNRSAQNAFGSSTPLSSSTGPGTGASTPQGRSSMSSSAPTFQSALTTMNTNAESSSMISPTKTSRISGAFQPRPQTPSDLLDHLSSQISSLKMHHATLVALLPFTINSSFSRNSLQSSGTLGDNGVHPSYAAFQAAAKATRHNSIPSTIQKRSRSRSSEESEESSHSQGGAGFYSIPTTPTGHKSSELPSMEHPETEPSAKGKPSHQHRASMSSLFSEVASIYYDAEIDDEGNTAGDDDTWQQILAQPQHVPGLEVPSEKVDSLLDLPKTPRAGSFSTMLPHLPLPSPSTTTTGSASTSTSSSSVNRRKRLPAPTPSEEPSLISVLRKNVGKDMSTITFPLTFNEPLSLCQKMAEEIEYSQLLTKAATIADPIRRMALVAAFAISTYANARYRTSRKPFNPIMGETYELVREDLGFRFIAEKVSHRPPVLASHADGLGWSFWSTSAAKNKLSGMSLEIQPLGSSFVEFPGRGEKYTWSKPPSYMRNLVAGTKYLETIGDLEMINLSTGEECTITFKEGGWGGPSSRNHVSGVIRNQEGSKAAWIEGTWDSQLSVRYGSQKATLEPIWKIHDWPTRPETNYGFPSFTIELNELTPDLIDKIAPSDSRLRPDQRALEEGRIVEAEELKHKLEDRQRGRRGTVTEIKPKWFKCVGDPTENWEFIPGAYWDAREKGTLHALAPHCFET